MADILCLGQFTADVVVTPVGELPDEGKALFVENISLHNGGCACNTAIALRKLGVDTAVMGKVGRDAFGDFLIRIMNEARLDTRAMVRDDSSKTSSTVVLISPDGERSFLHYYGSNAKMSEADVRYEAVKTARILHVAAAFLVPGLDGEPMARILSRAKKYGVTTSLDTAWDAEGRWMKLIEPCLEQVDIFTPSIEEGRMLTGKQAPKEIVQVFLDYGIETVVLKSGADGCYAATADEQFAVAAFKVDNVVDTLGAGDAFTAGFLAARINGWDTKKSCIFANAVGASCIGAEASSGIKSISEILELYGIDG